MKLAYVDACVWITLVEGLDRYRPPIRAALASLTLDGWELCTSDAVRLEVVIRPLQQKDARLFGIYQELLDRNRSLSVPHTVFLDALDLANREGLKAMDAVHGALAAHHRCGRFVTTDPHFNSLEAVKTELISLPGE